MHTDALLQALLAAGLAGDVNAVTCLPCAGKSRDIIAFSAEFREVWPTIRNWPVTDRVALAKSAAVLENTVGGIGSVTVLDLLLRDLPADAEGELVDWVLANTVSYAYFSHGARSWRELKEINKDRRVGKAAYQKMTAAAEQERAEKAELRRAERATHNLPNAVRRGDKLAVAALLAAGAPPSVAAPDGTDLADYAIGLGHSEIAELLRAARVPPASLDRDR